MVGTFACPDCGSLLPIKGHVAGLRTRCEECGTLVEVPYLPRRVGRGRTRHHALGWSIAGGGVVVAVLMVVVAVNTARGRGQEARFQALQEQMASAEFLLAKGHWDDAISQTEAAMKIAARLEPSSRVASARLARDGIVLRAVGAKLQAARNQDRPLSALRKLRSQIRDDPALEPLSDRAEDAFSEALERQALADLDEASRAFAMGQATKALTICERVARAAQELGFSRASSLRESANRIVESMVGQVGVTPSPVEGTFLGGPGAAGRYSRTLHPMLVDALKGRGYLPRPSQTAFGPAWDRPLPFRLSLEIEERYAGVFFQTPLRTFHINGHAELFKGPTATWQARFQGQTRVPPPGMSAFESSRLSLAKQREPEAENRLYDDAIKVLADHLAGTLGKIPPP